MGCLCGCGSNDQRCLRPNRPPSPNTFYENWWAPEFTYMLQTRLEKVAMRLEPSKRIWWREEFGGCAPDREPLDSEIWNTKYEDRGNVLRTSPPPCEDQPQVSQQDQCSNDLLKTRNSSPDEAPTVRRKPRPPKSPTHYIPDKFPALQFPDPATIKASQRKPKVYTAEEEEQFRQSALRKQKLQLEQLRLYGIPLNHGERLPTESSVAHSDRFEKTPNSIPVQDEASKPEKHQQVRQSPTDDYLTRSQQEWNGPAPLPVRPKVRSPKSPTHYIPDKFPPLQFPDPTTRKALQRKPRDYTAEEDEQLLQSALRIQEANDLERKRLFGIPLNQSGLLPTESSNSIVQSDRFEQVPTNTPFQDKVSKPEGHQQLKHLPTNDHLPRFRQERNGSPPLPARGISYPDNQRESVSRGPSVRPKVKSPKSPTHYIPDRLPPLNIPDYSKEHPPRHALRMEKKPTAEDDDQLLRAGDSWPIERIVEVMRLEKLRRQEHKQLKKSLYQKIEAMNLRRSHRRGITFHQFETVSRASPHSFPHVDSVEEELSMAEVYPASEDLRQLKPSLLEKIEAMKLNRSHRQGTAIHRSEASVPMSSDSSSLHIEIEEASSEIVIQRTSSEVSPQRLEPSLWNKVESMKQRLSRQQGTAIYKSEQPRTQDSASPPASDRAPGVLLGTQEHKQYPMLDRRPNFGLRSCQDLETLRLERSSRRGIALSV